MVEQRGQPLYSGQLSQKIREQALLVMVFFVLSEHKINPHLPGTSVGIH